MLAPVPALASDECVVLGWGMAGATATDGRTTHEYRFRLDDARWKPAPFGYHSAGILSYRAAGDSRTMSGMYHFFSDRSTDGAGAVRPSYELHRQAEGSNPFSAADMPTAEARIAHGGEWIGYPYRLLRGRDLDVLWTRSDLRLGDFRGYAVARRIDGSKRTASGGFGSAATPGYIVALNMRDGCLVMELLMDKTGGKEPDVALAASLEAALSVFHTTRPATADEMEQRRFTLARRAKRERDRRARRRTRAAKPDERMVREPSARNDETGILDELR